ncbi:MAG: hypothetical protein HY791_02320 [Deltaproteobacteria bacterium]|nr:hypothetical protein [Deltaproteobacteria bacterium]
MTEPVSSELARLFLAERDAVREDDELRATKEHVKWRLELSSALAVGLPVLATGGPARKGLLAVTKKAIVATSIASFAAGAAAGSVATKALTSPATPFQTQSSPAAAVEAVAPPATDASTAPSPSSVLDSGGSREGPEDAGTRAARVPRRRDELALEREILDVAQAALGRGDIPLALRSIEGHARRWPAGALVEEREALWILVLAKEGKKDEAEKRAEKFHREFPGSIYGPPIERAVAK